MTKLYRDESEAEIAGLWPGSGGVPGKRSMTQGLAPRALVFRVESAEAARELGAAFGRRDGNGVAADAEGAVDRAASSNGEPLRADLRERFESSLGADLSAVRVHRSADSAEASAAVGAKAYTVGSDIHFGAGQYRPDDPFGMHLLAHEVAHTQQQAGGPARRQHKLEVSSPGDHAEVEADRAADAMVAGTAIVLGSRASALSREAKPAETPFEGQVSFAKGPLTVDITGASDGKLTISGSLSATARFPTPIPWLFFELTGGGKLAGGGSSAKDGSASGSVDFEVGVQGTLRGGIPKVASVGAGAALAIKSSAKFTRGTDGKWTPDWGENIALVGKLVVDIKAEALDLVKLPPGWTSGLTYSYSPGGEQELAVLNVKTGAFGPGKDVAAIASKIKAILTAAGLMEGEKLKGGVMKGPAAMLAAQKARTEREAQHKADNAEYNAEHNPNAQQSSQNPDDLAELDRCEPPS